MVVAVANIVAVVGGIGLIGGLIWAASHGNGDREAEAEARDYFSAHGHWPDEAPTTPGTPPRRD
jgi:hypothetical protein